jgi:hypothetical protein
VNLKKNIKKGFKIFFWIVGSIIGIFLLLALSLQIPFVQNLAKEKAVSYIEGKIHTKVSIDRIEIGLPKKVILEGIYFEDQKNDTLLAGKKLAIDISLFQLMNNKVEINSASLEGITANIKRDKDSVFNFDYIIKAFASPKKSNNNSPPMEFSLGKINIDNLKFKYLDALSKNDIAVTLNHFDTRIKTFELDKMNFEIPKVKIDGAKLKMKQGLVETLNEIQKKVAIKADKINLKIQLGEIDLSKIDIDFQEETNRLNTKLVFEKLQAKFNTIDLQNQLIDIETLTLSDTKGDLAIGKLEKTVTENNISTTPTNNWKIKTNKINLEKVNFHFDNQNSVAVKNGIDYQHLDIDNFNLQAEKLNYNPEKTSGIINSLSIKEKKGLNVQSLKTNFVYNDQGVNLKNLYLKTPQTILRNEIIVSYPSRSILKEYPGELYINAHLTNSKLSIKELLLFAPTLENTPLFTNNQKAVMSMNVTIIGKLKNISFPNLEVSGIGTTKIAVSGKIVGLPNSKIAYYNLKIKNLQSNAKDVNNILPKGTVSNSIQLPSQFTTKGTFKGTMSNFKTNLNIISSYGNAKIKAVFDQRIKNKETYNAQIEIDNFDLGKLIKNDTIGKITLKATIKGTGLNPKTANAMVDGMIAKVNFKKYTYQNITVKGKINNGLFDANINTKDPNLTFDLVSNGSFRDKYPSGKLHLNVDIADLNKLNLHAGAMKMRGELDADIQSADLDYLNGNVNAHHIIIANEKDQFVLDSITLTATSTAEKNTLLLKSQFINANVDGKYKLSQIGAALQNSIAKYYDSNSNTKKSSVESQHFVFNMNVKDSPILLKFVPELKSIEPITISGRYDSVNDTIILNGKIPKLVYGKSAITNAEIKVYTKDKTLLYNLMVDDIQNPQFQLPYTNIVGKVENDVIDYALQLKDLNNKERYFISGTLKTKNGNSAINLNPKNLLLNYDSWNLSENNEIRFGRNGLYANDFELSKAGNSIKIQSQSEQPHAPITIDFKDFEIETITNIAQKTDFQMSGKINGNALIKNIEKSALFTSDLTIEDFAFRKDKLGTLKINVNNQIANQYDAKILLTGQDNQLSLDGNYKTTNSNFDLNLDITKLHVKSIQGFTFDNIKESTGFVSGNFKIKGTTAQPLVLGDLQFHEVGFKVTQLNANFKSMNDKIVFLNNSATLDNFTIKDETNNELIINGKVTNQNNYNFGFNLTVDADNFKAVNSKSKDNPLYYGELYLDNHLTVKGTLNQPIVEGEIKINKDTKFTVVLPQSDPSIADREGIVEFIDQDQPKLITTVSAEEALSQTEIKGIIASVNIEIDKEAELSMIIDKANGDYLKLKGEAQLTGGIDASGKTTLTGRYEFTGGTYEMNFNLIKRKFDIKKGSYILWTGEPTTADINITAVYKIETAPINLLNDQLMNLTPEERNTYKQKIPFETELKMKGDLLKPDITFDVILPEGNNSVSAEIIDATQAKLAQLRQEPDELNKQVFALLLLNRFIGENPFSSESGGTTASSLARESVSKVLSQQLNNLAADLINGVELDFNLDTSQDYTTGKEENRTDLNVGLSKKLLNDRLKVTVGSSFGIEGEKQENQQANNIAGDIAAEYQISKDGRYKIRAYRKNKYQVALQGQVIETGVGFIITIDYNKFREIFHRKQMEKSKEPKKKPND